jgi:hypothetical protein
MNKLKSNYHSYGLNMNDFEISIQDTNCLRIDSTKYHSRWNAIEVWYTTKDTCENILIAKSKTGDLIFRTQIQVINNWIIPIP